MNVIIALHVIGTWIFFSSSALRAFVLVNEYIFLSLIANEPDLSGLVVSNITSDRFSLSWRAGEKAFDNFVVEVRESALPSQAMGRVLPADVRSTVMAGLKASTSYGIKLYGSARGRNTQPLFALATTGIASHAFLVPETVLYRVSARRNGKIRVLSSI